MNRRFLLGLVFMCFGVISSFAQEGEIYVVSVGGANY